MKIIKRLATVAFISVMFLGVTVPVLAHGYVAGGLKSRSVYTYETNPQTIGYCPACVGEAQIVPTNMTEGKRDGQIANVQNPVNEGMNTPGDIYYKNDVKSGSAYDINWNFTAPHNTESLNYYITKDGWNYEDGLQWEDFEPTPLQTPTGEVAGSDLTNGLKPAKDRTDTLVIPEGKEGYHVIVYDWRVTSPTTQWTSVIDLNVTDSAPVVSPSNLAVSDVTTTSATATWNTGSELDGYKSTYNVYLNNKLVGTTSDESYKFTGLTPSTTYTVSVLDNSNGNKKDVTFTTKEAQVEKQSPYYLHSMGTTSDGFMVMWNMDSFFDTYVSTYELYLDGTYVTTTSETDYTFTGLKADTMYNVRVVDTKNNNASELFIKTKPSSSVGTWKNDVVYNTGDKVVIDGVEYTAQWWNLNQSPLTNSGGAGSGKVWVPTKTSTNIPTWNANDVYVAGDVVKHQGVKYKASWWNQGQAPDVNNGMGMVWQVVK